MAFNKEQVEKLRILIPIGDKTPIYEDTLSEISLQLSLHQYLTNKRQRMEDHERERGLARLESRDIQHIMKHFEILHDCFCDKEITEFKERLWGMEDSKKVTCPNLA